MDQKSDAKKAAKVESTQDEINRALGMKADEQATEPRGYPPPPKPAEMKTSLRFKSKAKPAYPSPPPVDDEERDPNSVVDELLGREMLFDPIRDIYGAWDDVDQFRRDMTAEQNRRMATWFLENVVHPMIRGLANQTGEKPENIMVSLIRSGTPIGAVFLGHENTVAEMMRDSRIRMLTAAYQHLGSVNDEEIRRSIYWWMDRIREVQPGYARIIESEQNGVWWIQESLIDIVNLLKGKL